MSGQSPPVDATQTSTSNGGDTPQDPSAGIGAAPAQLVNNLLQTEMAIGNTPAASTVAASQTAPNNADKKSDEVNARQALIARLQQAANLTDAQPARAPAGQSGQTNSAGAATGSAAGDASQNSTPAADNGPVRPATQQAAPATSTAAATDARNLVSLIPTSTTSSTAGTATGSPSGSSPSKDSSAATASVASAADDVPSALPAGLPANGSGNSQPPPQADSNSLPGNSASVQFANQVPGAVIRSDSNFARNEVRQSAAIQAAPLDSLSASVPVSASVLPASAAASPSIVLDAGNPAQPANSNDASQPPQASGPQTPGYLLFGAAPASLQLQVMNFSASQTAPTDSLSSLVLDQAAYAVQYSHANGQQMQLHLNPPELGALQVDVSMHDGVLSARIEAQTTTAQQILTDNMTQLKHSLTQQGVSFDRIDVHLAGSNADSGGTGTADKSFAQQQDGGLPWDQQFVQPESDDPALRAPVPTIRTARTPLTTLDIMI